MTNEELVFKLIRLVALAAPADRDGEPSPEVVETVAEILRRMKVGDVAG